MLKNFINLYKNLITNNAYPNESFWGSVEEISLADLKKSLDISKKELLKTKSSMSTMQPKLKNWNYIKDPRKRDSFKEKMQVLNI